MKAPLIRLAPLMISSLLLARPASAQELTRAVEFQTLAKNVMSGHAEKMNYVITSKEEWEALWDKISSIYLPRPAAPEVDFSGESVIAVFQGSQPSSGYSTTVTRLVKSGKKLKVLVREVLPADDCPVLLVITRPYEIIRTAKVRDADRVVFKVKQDVKVCRQD
jgi:hypothetical protein